MQREEGERGGKGKKQKQPKLSNLFIRGFVFEHLNESCLFFIILHMYLFFALFRDFWPCCHECAYFVLYIVLLQGDCYFSSASLSSYATNKEQSENERLCQKVSLVNSLAAYTVTLDPTA